MKNLAVIAALLFLLVMAAGCAQAPPTQPPTEPSAAEPSADISEQYIAKAQELEAQGDLVGALEQYKVALTVNPQSQLAQEKKEQIESTLGEMAETHYQDGLVFHRKGEYSRARQEFLTALRYNPDHQEAKNMLQEHQVKEQQIKGYVLHAIQHGESISMVAKKYYGDYKKFQIIAEYNQMEDATRVTVGQKIKVPVVDGMPFFAKPEDIITSSGETAPASLTEVVPVKSFTLHTVEPGESLSKLALRYYGDYKKFFIIAQYNQLDENVGLRVGQKIKIPEIEGVSFAQKPVKKEVQPAVTPVTTAAVTEPQTREKVEVKEEEKVQEKVEAKEEKAQVEKEIEKPEEKVEAKEEEKELAAVDQSADYRELGIEFFNEKDYPAAISEFKKVLNVNPADKTALEYISDSHFQQGLVVFTKEDYLTARDEFKASLRYNEACEKCGEYIKRCEKTYMDIHYNRGLSHFRDEKLAEAVQEWELVSSIDPKYEDVDNNLKKARKLLERLESIKRSRTKKQSQ